MKLDKNGLEFIQNEEGLRLKAYKCPAGVWTIGWGNTYNLNNTPVKEGQVITKDEAVSLFENKIKLYESAVNKNVKVTLTQNAFNALVSFCYNVGMFAFASSTLLKKVNSKASLPEIFIEFKKWVHAGKVIIDVLVNRRKREIELYKS
ncbi:lysozyme [Pedobacter fastidiosus]|uniref:Lysozyme n=1 Tax=Pedobacter fastidiosus TaxID=2765361 RepID=A0ABR7KSU3_9SPHI|nr:lysozyme [Pedobacter fastidiosus]MBC6111179.1 lysozyme [Pedobacter fastidiosus]